MAGFIPAIHVLAFSNQKNVEMAGTSPAMTINKSVSSIGDVPGVLLRLPDLGQFDLDPQFDFRQHGIEAGIAG